jgi:hypothetical protein
LLEKEENRGRNRTVILTQSAFIQTSSEPDTPFAAQITARIGKGFLEQIGLPVHVSFT